MAIQAETHLGGFTQPRRQPGYDRKHRALQSIFQGQDQHGQGDVQVPGETIQVRSF